MGRRSSILIVMHGVLIGMLGVLIVMTARSMVRCPPHLLCVACCKTFGLEIHNNICLSQDSDSKMWESVESKRETASYLLV